MRNIAIVEDENKAAVLLKGYVEEYAQKNNQKFQIDRFTNGVDFLDNYKSTYAVVFMDIQMHLHFEKLIKMFPLSL